MINMNQIRLIILGFSLLLFSCQEVIDLNLETRSARLVIEGIVTDKDAPFEVKLSQSVNYDVSNNFPSISGAQVSITNEAGTVESLVEEEIGTYRTAGNYRGVPGATYFLKIVADGKEYTATASMPEKKVVIDSLSFVFEEESLFQDEGFYVSCHFTDPAGTPNYYRIKVLVNGAPFVFDFDGTKVKDNNLRLTSDKFSDGNNREFDFDEITLVLGDVVFVELDNIDNITYDYYRSLQDAIDGEGVAPSNPVTNITGGAMGYFGAIAMDSQSITIQ